jgi:hypothetical protein
MVGSSPAGIYCYLEYMFVSSLRYMYHCNLRREKNKGKKQTNSPLDEMRVIQINENALMIAKKESRKYQVDGAIQTQRDDKS